jgi:hypothetical protein
MRDHSPSNAVRFAMAETNHAGQNGGIMGACNLLMLSAHQNLKDVSF